MQTLHAPCGLPKYATNYHPSPPYRALTYHLFTPQITNPQLRERINNVAVGLSRMAGLVPQESNVLLLLNDGIGACFSSSPGCGDVLLYDFPSTTSSTIPPILVVCSNGRGCVAWSGPFLDGLRAVMLFVPGAVAYEK